MPTSVRFQPGRPRACRAKTGRMMNIPNRRSPKIEASEKLARSARERMRAGEFTEFGGWNRAGMLRYSSRLPSHEPLLHGMETIRIRGARTHNLRNVSLDLPRNKLVVITGLSASGKSSLAFDTLYAEGQRRYVESLSAYARQFLQLMVKPDVDLIEGLSPAIAIEQKAASHNPRSTVGTVTEIHDYLRLLYARVGTPYCPEPNLAL